VSFLLFVLALLVTRCCDRRFRRLRRILGVSSNVLSILEPGTIIPVMFRAVFANFATRQFGLVGVVRSTRRRRRRFVRFRLLSS
jgi:hypothetical protein